MLSAVQSARPGYSRTCTGAEGRQRRPEYPGVPRCARCANLCARERSAYHGTWSAGGGRSHDDRNCSRSKLSPPIITLRTLVFRGVPASRCRVGQCLQLVAHPRRACCFIHPRGGGTHHSPALRCFAFSITSVGSTGRVLSVSSLRLVCRFNLWVHSQGAVTVFSLLGTCFLLQRFLCTWARTRREREFPKYCRRNQLAF